MKDRRRWTSSLAGALALAFAATPCGAGEAAMPSEQEAYEIARDAYVYFYPLVLMDVTRAVVTNADPGRPYARPMNGFAHLRAFPPPSFRAVVRPNFDTLYSAVWLDLSKEPVIVSVPDTGGRYYLLQMLDMWTDVFAVVGKRTTGTAAGDYAVTMADWRGELPPGVSRIDAPTPYVWIIGRTQTNGPTDYPAVHVVQDGFRATPLSQWGREPQSPAATFDPAIDMKTPPPRQVASMPAPQFFARAAALLKLHPPHLVDQPILARLRRIGIAPGNDFDPDHANPLTKRALERAAADGLALMRETVTARSGGLNGWRIETSAIGVYGTSYLRRAVIAMTGLGVNLPEDAAYPSTAVDKDGKPLDGAHRYVIRFAKGELPPVEAFWSITAYDPDGYVVANAINRFAIGDRDALKTNADGSLAIFLSADSPGDDAAANWLPVPPGPFNITMRLYAPRESVLLGRWLPPPVGREP
jgi:hypothetical protein